MSKAGPGMALAGQLLQATQAEPWPAIVTEAGAPVMPLKIGIHHDLLAGRKSDVSKTMVRDRLRRYVSKFAYQKALAEEGAERHDLNGRPLQPVEQPAKDAAQANLHRRAGRV